MVRVDRFMTITLKELYDLVRKRFPSKPLTLPFVLTAWAMEDPEAHLHSILSKARMDPQRFAEALAPFLEQPSEQDKSLLSACIVGVLHGPVTGAHLLAGLIRQPDHRITKALTDHGLDLVRLQETLARLSPEDLHPMTRILSSHTPVSQENGLLRYGRDLVKLAKEGAFAELSDRPSDLERLIEILMKKQKGHAVLTGHAGVGKTALVELLARKIVEGRLPYPPAHTPVFEIRMGSLLAGTIYRGEFEARMEEVIGALKAYEAGYPERSVILFIDEIHLIFGAGRSEGSPMDAANLLKPLLARSRGIHVIGATTGEEYHRYFSRDLALSRRFEELRIEEPSGELAWIMVSKQAQALADHHRIDISEDITRYAIELADRYLPNRRQPDKTVDLLDSGAVYVLRSNRSRIEKSDLLEVLSIRTGYDIHTLSDEDQDDLSRLGEALKRRIVGQDEAIEAVVATLGLRRQDLGDRRRNVGTFLFAGATGVGKTELARSIAKAYFGDENRLLHLDLAEYSHSISMTKLLGAPPGYVGSEQEGVLSGWLQSHNSGVILFDEIEKAHPQVHQVLLGLLDEGRIRSARGEVMRANQCVIVATTNALTPDQLRVSSIGFSVSREKPDLFEMLRAHFSPEFLGRFDEMVLFHMLGERELKAILRMRLNEAVLRLAEQKIDIVYQEEPLLDYLLQSLLLNKTGARGIARLLERQLLQPAAKERLRARTDTRICIVVDESFYTQGRLDVRNNTY